MSMNTDILKLRERRGQKADAARAIVTASEQRGDVMLNASDKAKFKALMEESKELAAEIERQEQLLDLERELDAPLSSPPNVQRLHEQVNAHASSDGRSFRAMFGPTRGNAGFRTFGEYFEALAQPMLDPRLAQLDPVKMGAGPYGGALNETVPSEGGFLVSSEHSALLFDKSLPSEVVRSRATIYPMRSEERRIPAYSEDRSTGAVYGFRGTWSGELQLNLEQFPEFRELTLRAKKLALYSRGSREVVADAPSFDEILVSGMTRAIGYHLDAAFLNGNGVGKPLGVLQSPSLLVVPKTAAQPAATITYANIVALFSKLGAGYQSNAVWLVSPSTLPMLMQLSIPIGTAGTHIPLTMQPDGSLRLMGLELVKTEHLPPLGEQGDIVLADLTSYLIGVRQEILVDRSTGPGWYNDSLAYRVIVRVDGMPSLDQVQTSPSGDTSSWAVTLATRS